MTDLATLSQAALHGQWNCLLGLPETSWLDVKSSIYNLDQAGPRAELCKDVAAMANAQGGLLLIGLRTELVDGREVISELKPVPQRLVDQGRHRKILMEQVRPPVRDLRIEWVPCQKDSGVLVLHIPPQPSADKPFVVPATDPKGREGVAVPVRSGDDTSWLKPAELQRLLALGWSSSDEASGPLTTGTADQNTAARLLRLVPLDAPWIKHLRNGGPYHRIPAAVSDEVHDAAEALEGEVLRFRDPGLAAATESFTNAVCELSNVFGGLHTPMDGPLTYFVVPPEWKRTDPARYYEALRENDRAAQSVLDAYQDWVNKLNEKGLLV
ncbi:helix-turn-helix domain-containing protein [Streptomyces sp. NPDC001406]|uniref:AlbA family DNA-binding domain-containing protein n=1 Tax=Streptomyces sp. NPDC001406 TaxID=3364572 RepID=UPI0036AA1E70